MKNKNICIMGATSHIAAGLISSFASRGGYHLYLFARNTGAVCKFADENSIFTERYNVRTFDDFQNYDYDVIINCVGIADPGKQRDAGNAIFFITEKFDNMVLDYLKSHKETLYINFSSGAVYGTAFEKPVDRGSTAEIPVNDITDKDYYRIAKLYSEARHRSLKEFNIVDLRVFSYFSRFIDLSTKFLMTEIVNSIKNEEVFVTNNVNIVRDYIHISDLFSLIECCVQKNIINDVFDVYSRAPVEKFDLLDVLNRKFGLKYRVENSTNVVNATGVKSIYYSENFHASGIGYSPVYSSIETIEEEIGKILP